MVNKTEIYLPYENLGSPRLDLQFQNHKEFQDPSVLLFLSCGSRWLIKFSHMSIFHLMRKRESRERRMPYPIKGHFP